MMGKVTYFVVLPFEPGDEGELVAGEAREAVGARAAVRMAARLAGAKPGVVAFARSGDMARGEYDDAVILARHGVLPADVETYVREAC